MCSDYFYYIEKKNHERVYIDVEIGAHAIWIQVALIHFVDKGEVTKYVFVYTRLTAIPEMVIVYVMGGWWVGLVVVQVAQARKQVTRPLGMILLH